MPDDPNVWIETAPLWTVTEPVGGRHTPYWLHYLEDGDPLEDEDA